MDCEQTIQQGRVNVRVSTMQYCLDLVHVAGARASRLGDLPANIHTVSLRQICRTLTFAPRTHVLEGPLPKMGLQCQRQANANKVIPSAPGLMVGEYEL